MKIGFIPIDNRPVCYTLPRFIAEIDESLELFMPERELLGGLKKDADVLALIDWLENAVSDVDALVISLDTIAYGGLIPSRRSDESFESILARLQKLKNVLKGKKVYAFSSIMRISNNNINEEEKPYWDKWGKKIFDYSWHSHKNNCESCIMNVIPSAILDDYMATRRRNFEINKIYLEWQKEGIFDTLIFSKDDCAEYGFNVQEANALKALGATVKTGADEIPLSLFARAIPGSVKICPNFVEPGSEQLISNYEDIPLVECVYNQIELAGCEVVEDGADINLIVNNFKERQGEIVMKVPTEPYGGTWVRPKGSYAVADVRNANGADNAFVEALFRVGLGENFLGYSAWNTSANTLGSLILSLKIIFNAKKNGTFNIQAFNKLQMTRFLDDWAYQANVRQELLAPDCAILQEKMANYQAFLLEMFPCSAEVTYKFPWERLFEVEVDFS